METATPGVKSTRGRLAEPLPARARARGGDAVSRRRAGAAAAAHRCRAAPALAMARSASSASAPAGDRHGAGVVRGAVRRGRRSRAATAPAREAFDAVKMLKTADPSQYQPDNGAEYPRSPFGEALKQIAQLDQRRRRPRGRVRRSRRLGHPRQPGGGAGPARRRGSTTSRAASRRSSPTSATAWRTSSS